MKNVLVLLPVQERHKEILRAAGEGCELTFVPADEVTEAQVQAAEVILGNPPAELLKASEQLKLLQVSTAGTDPYIAPGVLGPHTLLTNSTGAYSQAVAEHAFALTLMLQKKLHLYHLDQTRALWSEHGTVSSLCGSTVVIVGLGDIGRYYANLVKAMGAYVIGVKRRGGEKPDCVDELCLTAELDRVLPRADVVMSVLPNTAGTVHFYTDACFDLMKESAIFINCGRGSAVASDVLYRALTEHKIAAAGVDVTEPEPLPADSPLWGLEDLVITPHISGWNHLPETFERVVRIAAENLSAYCKGEPLRNLVDRSTGYKI